MKVNDWNFIVNSSNFYSPPGYAQLKAFGKTQHPESGDILNGTLLLAVSASKIERSKALSDTFVYETSSFINLVDCWDFEVMLDHYIEGPNHCNYTALGRMKHPISGIELQGFLSFMASPFGNLTIDSPKGDTEVYEDGSEVVCCPQHAQ